ncbi:MAG: FHA domain-containing protein [Desulfobacteraceae bacterium]|nr:FHA domain-containing protein [Desulfobacteraceae bacterium]
MQPPTASQTIKVNRPPVKITILSGDSDQKEYMVTEEAIIGRGSKCNIQIKDNVVSRAHCRVVWEADQWWLEDLESANGIFVEGLRVWRHPLQGRVSGRLGDSGPALQFEVEIPALPQHRSTRAEDLAHYKSHYFGDSDGPAGEHTMMVRRAYAEVQKKQKRFYYAVIGLVVLLLAVSAGYAFYRHSQQAKQRLLAAEIFYKMKTLEVQLAQLIKETEQHQSLQTEARIEQFKQNQKEMEESYNQFTDTLNVYDKGLSEEQRLVMKIARVFGECEITMPDAFTRKVQEYINRWKSTDRLKNAVQRAQKNGYVQTIADTLVEHGLPAQFFYLALQESNMSVNAVGPPTRFGIAKGMWQFIPATATKYGLRPGPLVDEAKQDPLDDRHHFGRSTLAAARYLRDIYTTDAQASGLLVMASYNWGEQNVVPLLQKMPQNPRERNFWELIAKYGGKVPEQTYDYVFSIVSAAVIGENPRLFGFDFDNPLAQWADSGVKK